MLLTRIPSHLEVGWYLRLIDSCIAQLKAQGSSRKCNESKEEKQEEKQKEKRNSVFGVGGWVFRV